MEQLRFPRLAEEASAECRYAWIEDRILELAECFAVSVFAYAVMSNHSHIVLHVDPQQPWELSDQEVANRWLTAFPGRLKHLDCPEQQQRYRQAVTGDPEKLELLRSRLGSLSWFMKALNEPIARMANREDECTGKFWEGRFKCQALLEPHAILSCMAYVDLNPVRAAMCHSLDESSHTSVLRRIIKGRAQPTSRTSQSELGQPLKPVAGLDAGGLLGMTEQSYIDLVQWTGEHARSDKRGKLRKTKSKPPEAIWQVTEVPQAWIRQVQGTESRYFRAIGSAKALMDKAAELGQIWMKGVAGERALQILRERPT